MTTKIKKIILSSLAILNVLSGGLWLALTLRGNSLAKAQGCNYAAQRWAPNGGFTQISCFFTEDSGFTSEETFGVKSMLVNKLRDAGVTPEENITFIPDAYSTDAGQMSFRCDSAGRSEAQVTAVGGDFFLFRDFYLLDGAYFSDNDLMQDGAVIDRRLAWALYGSTNVAGMNIYINGTKFYISGVIEDPETKAEKKTAGDLPRAYISYDGADLLGAGQQSDGFGFDSPDGFAGNSGLKKVSCYECIVPDPVENYAYNAVKEYFEGSYKNTSVTVNNTERFKPSALAKKHKNLSEYAISDKAIIYPYWENASRITEFKLSGIYFLRRFTCIIPGITLLIITVILWRTAGRIRRKLTSKTGEAINDAIYWHGQKKRIKKENKENQKNEKENR